MSKVIGIYSAKGGVGKTTTTINVASALIGFGRNVLIVDSDLTSPNVGVYLGTTEIPVSLNSVLKGENKIQNAIYRHNSGLNIILGSLHPNTSNETDYKAINKEIEKIKDLFEIILIDSAPGRFEESINQMNVVNSILIVTTPELAAVTDALRTITIARQKGKKILGIALTRVNNHDHEMQASNIESMLSAKILASIPEDKKIPLSARITGPVVQTHPNTIASIAYKELAATILGTKYKKIDNL